MLVLVTRPREQAAETARLLRAAGHEVLIDPVLEIRRLPLPSAADRHAAAVAVTSANAVPALAGLPGDVPVFAVGDGDRTRAARRRPRARWRRRGRRLDPGRADRRTDRAAGGAVLHPCGRGRPRGPGGGAGRPPAIGYRRAVVYEAVPASRLAGDGRGRAARAAGSTRCCSSRRAPPPLWAGLVRAAGLAERTRPMLAACLSEAVAAALAICRFARGPGRRLARPKGPAALP